MPEIKLQRRTPEEQAQKMLEAYTKLAGEKAAVEHKSIAVILEEIANEFCDNYCKYPDSWDEEAEGCELSESEICSGCPINRLV